MVKDFHHFHTIGQTRDDAAGEAFDKAAKLLDIGYPGGVVIDKLAKKGDREAINFPRSMKGSLDFSFSGLKTSLLNYVKRNPVQDGEIPNIAASYQEAIVEVLVSKTLKAATDLGISRVVVAVAWPPTAV